ncbi:toll/interleukin-1 receptor domain-containing protein [Paenibacillus swuensis]|uniref:toll/interleukin-1 receptor domain-containing protein n=1 Tax=Paenibacillus swuensis TaxID=1178515 RepID=UPI0009ED9ADD|nr:toll/interleukin-1 receptor domain-containing protein [Paenibacillus swuensis]
MEQRLISTQQNLTRELEYQRNIIQENNIIPNTVVATNVIMIEKHEPMYDVFISHASEDKDEFVRPLAEELSRIGVNVLYDVHSIIWGDSLRQSIDRGLANSKYGVIVISSSIINKRWPAYELDGLIAREMEGRA